MLVTKIRYVQEGEKLPWWLGLAYWEWSRPVAVCYPIPLNLLIRWSRNVYFWVKASHRPDWLANRLQEAHDAGFHKGIMHELRTQAEWLKLMK